MGIQALSAKEIQTELTKLPLWRLDGKEIVRQFEFKAFMGSIEFVNGVAAEAEKADHHPDILIQYNKVTLRLSTHDCDGLSSRDFALAHKADGLYS
jgi:4a-hydroxytetrahydrobiopterin dehydratase